MPEIIRLMRNGRIACAPDRHSVWQASVPDFFGGLGAYT